MVNFTRSQSRKNTFSSPRVPALEMLREKTLHDFSNTGLSKFMCSRTEQKYTLAFCVVIRQPAIPSQNRAFKIPERVWDESK